MRRHVGTAIITVAAVLTFFALPIVSHFTGAHAASTIAVSGDVSRLPTRADIDYQPLSPSDVHVSADEAASVAEARMGLPAAAVDQSVGVVRALVGIRTVPNGPGAHMRPAWIVTMDDEVRGPGNGVLYHKMCIAVDAATGTFLYAYAVDPQ